MAKHSPQIQLVNARVALDNARNACPHWDFESDGGADECCYRVAEAQREYRRAKRNAS